MTFWDGYFKLECFDKDGNLKWTEEGHNSLTKEGQQSVSDTYFRGQNAPTQFYIRLCGGTPNKTMGLTALTGEPTTNGYTPQLIERSTIGFPTLAVDATTDDYKITSKQVTFSATGGSWGPVTNTIFATTSDNSGKFIAFKSLSQSRTLADGETLKVTYSEKFMPSA